MVYSVVTRNTQLETNEDNDSNSVLNPIRD